MLKKAPNNHGFLTLYAFKFFLMLLPSTFLNSISKISKPIFTQFKSESNGLIGNLYGTHGAKEIMSIAIFGKKTQLNFESNVFNVPEFQHNYLENLYGNYRDLPLEFLKKGHYKNWPIN